MLEFKLSFVPSWFYANLFDPLSNYVTQCKTQSTLTLHAKYLYEINVDIDIIYIYIYMFDNIINSTYYILLKLTNDILILVPYKYIIEL